MKTTFKYKFTKVFYALFIAGILLATVCIGENVRRFILLLSTSDASATNYVASALSVIIGILGFIFIIPAMISSKYEIKKQELITKWGLITNKTNAKNITQITFFRITEKLVIYYDDDTYSNVCIDKNEFDDFVKALRDINPKIFYSLDTENQGEK